MIGIVATVRGPWTEVEDFINYYLQCEGITRLFIYFDDKNYSYTEQIKKYQSKVIAKICDNAYWSDKGMQRNPSLIKRQKTNIKDSYEIAKLSGLQWLIHLDLDERLMFNNSLADELKAYTKQITVERFQVYEYVPEVLPDGTEIYFRTQPINSRRNVIPRFKDKIKLAYWNLKFKAFKLSCYLLGYKSLFKYGYLKAHIGGKAAFRVDNEIKYKAGIHTPFPVSGESFLCAISNNTVVLHFDCLSYQAWYEKFKNKIGQTQSKNPEFINVEKGVKKNRKQLIHAFENCFFANDEKSIQELYKQNYQIPKSIRWFLLISGFLVKIKNPPKINA